MVWILDPIHGEDSWFSIIGNEAINDRDKDTKIPLIKRLFTLEFYQPGDYDIHFLLMKADMIPQMIKAGSPGSRFSIDDTRIV